MRSYFDACWLWMTKDRISNLLRIAHENEIHIGKRIFIFGKATKNCGVKCLVEWLIFAFGTFLCIYSEFKQWIGFLSFHFADKSNAVYASSDSSALKNWIASAIKNRVSKRKYFCSNLSLFHFNQLLLWLVQELWSCLAGWSQWIEEWWKARPKTYLKWIVGVRFPIPMFTGVSPLSFPAVWLD